MKLDVRQIRNPIVYSDGLPNFQIFENNIPIGKTFLHRADAEAALKKLKRDRRNANRRERDAVFRDTGLTKVRGALGGTYWE